MTPTQDDESPPGRRGGARDGLARLLGDALTQFTELTNQQPERVSGLRSTDDGWSVLADVVELKRIPETTSVLATYRLDIDADGILLGYERLRRFVRGATDT